MVMPVPHRRSKFMLCCVGSSSVVLPVDFWSSYNVFICMYIYVLLCVFNKDQSWLVYVWCVQVSGTCVRMARKYKRTVGSRSYIAYSALSAVRNLTVRFASNIKRKRAEVGPIVIEE